MPRTVLVTGVAGFIGANLAASLVQRGDRVVGVDNLSMGRLENVAALLPSGRFVFHELDVLDAQAWQAFAGGCDAIIHLAASKIPRYGNAMTTLLTNTQGMKAVLDVAAQTRARVLLASTSDVYGKNPSLPFREDSDLVLGPSTGRRWSYAASKIFDEHLAFAYQDSHDVPTTILRFFGGYGPFEHRSWWGGPQSVFIEAVLSDAELEIHGDGEQTRTFLYAGDLVDGILGALDNTETKGEILNLGSTREISILDLARLINELCGTPGEIKLRFVPYSSFTKGYEDVRRRLPDVSKAQRLIGFAQKVSLEEGLTRTIAWHRAEPRDGRVATRVRAAR